MSVRLIACCLLAAPLLGGCLSDQGLGAAFDDASSATTIKTQLLGAGLNGRFMEVDVAVVDRFVLLSGRVASQADKQEAERIAWNDTSVNEVANELVIENWDLGRDMNDSWITEQVRLRLIGDNDIKGANYNIQVHDGVVYLLGMARSEDELRKAAEHASLVGGVQKVVSYVKMRERGQPPPNISTALSAPVAAQAPAGVAPAPAAPTDTTPGAIRIAPSAADPAPIVPPDQKPMTRQQYTDPYAPGAKPPPGANGNTDGLSNH